MNDLSKVETLFFKLLLFERVRYCNLELLLAYFSISEVLILIILDALSQDPNHI